MAESRKKIRLEAGRAGRKLRKVKVSGDGHQNPVTERKERTPIQEIFGECT